MRYEIILTPAAEKEFSKLPAGIRGRIDAALEYMRDDLRGDVKKLVNDPRYRVRVGDYRIIFDLFGNEVHVMEFKHRKDAYKKGW